MDVVHGGDKNQPLSQNGGKKSMVLNTRKMIGKIGCDHEGWSNNDSNVDTESVLNLDDNI